MHIAEWKKTTVWNGCMLYDSNYQSMPFWKRQRYRNNEKINGCHRLGWGRKGRVDKWRGYPSHMGLEPIPHLNLTTCAKTLFPNKVTFGDTGSQDFYPNWEYTIHCKYGRNCGQRWRKGNIQELGTFCSYFLKPKSTLRNKINWFK